MGPPYPHSLGRVGFASQVSQSLHTIRSALCPVTFLRMCPARVTRISLPRAGFLLVGVFGGRFSLPVTTRPVMLLAKRGKFHARPKGCFLTCAVVSAAARITRWPRPTIKSPLPSPLPSISLVPAFSCLPVPCLMPPSNPSAPRGGRPSVPFIVAQCPHSGAPRWRSRWVALFKGIGTFQSGSGSRPILNSQSLVGQRAVVPCAHVLFPRLHFGPRGQRGKLKGGEGGLHIHYKFATNRTRIYPKGDGFYGNGFGAI